MKKMPYKLLERFKDSVPKKLWEGETKHLEKEIPKIISDFETFYDRSFAVSILIEKDRKYLKRFIKSYIKKYLLRYPDENYIKTVYNSGKRLFSRGFTDEIIVETYKIVFKSVEGLSLLKEKVNFDFLIFLRPFVNYSLKEEERLIKNSNVEIVFSLQEAAKFHIENKNKFFKAIFDQDIQVIKNIPNYNSCNFTKWLENAGKKVLEEHSYKDVEHFHKIFHEKLEKIKNLLNEKGLNYNISVYMILKDIENISLKLLYLLNKISLDNISNIALKDSLTGFFNRHILDTVLAKEISRVKRYNYKLSIIMIDLDNFKKINDTYGHLVGDEVLMHFARVVKSNLRESDYAFRYGGEEFLILLPHTDLDGAVTVAERIRKQIEDYKFPVAKKITVSCGVKELINLDNPYLDIEMADRYLYIAKKSGKNKCVYER
jgi:diguanylate cyclase (GGDEF)-like protein